MTTVGFIGVGAMGSAIAGRLLGSTELLVNDRNPDVAKGLVDHGATFTSVADIAARCEVVFLCLPGPQQVADLVQGEEGLAGMLGEGTVLVDCSSSSPTLDAELAKVLAERGIGFVDSPIAGGVRRAREGTAVLMVGGDDAVFARVEPLLRAVTPDVYHMGPIGTGHAMKLVNNLLNNINRFAAMEVVRLGQAAGLTQDAVIEVVNKSSGRNYATEVTFPTMLTTEDYVLQGFSLELQSKDIRLALELAKDLHHSTPLGNTVQALADKAVDRWGPRADTNQMLTEWYQK